MCLRLITFLPTDAELLKAQDSLKIKQHLQKIKERDKFYYGKHRSRELMVFCKGDKVILKHDKKWVPTTVVEEHHTPRSYVVQTPAKGQHFGRNCRQLTNSRISQTPKKVTVETWQFFYGTFRET